MATETDSLLPRDPDVEEKARDDHAAEFAKMAFANLKLREWAEIKRAAEDLKLSLSKKVFAFLSLFAALFNLYVIINNWRHRPPDNSTGGVKVSQLLVFWVEFICLLAMLAYTALYSLVLFPCLRKGPVNGEQMGRIASMILTIGSFSIVKRISGLKSLPLTVINHWSLKYSEHSNWVGLLLSLGSIVIDIAFVLFSVLSFFLKLSQVAFVGEVAVENFTTPQWVAFFGFLNNMISLYNPSTSSSEAVMKFVFAGSDAKFTSTEHRIMIETQECIYYRLGVKDGAISGIAKILTLSTDDMQYILLTPVDLKGYKAVEVADDT
jgi:hypothetical protein